jgi:cob(I)alamin adenosyltransferase
MGKGKIHIYCGNGKGKTTASIGLSVRAIGRGFPVVLAQFLKGSSSGELKVLKDLPGYHIVPSPEVIKFIFQMTPEEKEACRQETEQHFTQTVAAVKENSARLLVMDEVLDAVSTGMLSDEELADFLKNKPEELEVVMTGRAPTPCTDPLADYITRMEKVRHPYDQGISARIGVEF